jgi:MFS superfamily sulfate permease-like transporter
MSESTTQIVEPGETKKNHWKADILSGFLVFLIAMPLCLAIAKASNYPPIAGIWTAVIGGIITCFISNSSLTIKGPAAGLIVIVAGAVTDLGKEFVPSLPESVLTQLKQEGKTDEQIGKELEFRQLAAGHQLALGVGMIAGLMQIGFGLLRAGKLGDFFPLPAVHGMLASIGIIIIAKQIYVVFGIDPPKNAKPLELLAQFPQRFHLYNPEIALIGFLGLVVLFGFPFLPFKAIKRVPTPLVVLAVALPIGMAFDLEHEHVYLFHDGFFETVDHEYRVGPRFLVDMPEVLETPSEAFFVPDFRGILTVTGLQYILMFSLIASLESLLSAKAIDLIDPWKRRTDLNRDLAACGIANTLTSCIGALPMISEIVRSKANVDNGARTKYANFFHALFLLGFVLVLPNLIHRIPLAALGAMLVYTGFRLAHPKEFISTYQIGIEPLMVFVATLVATLATDLLIGIAVGVLVKFLLHVLHGMPVKATFRAGLNVHEEGAIRRLSVRDAAVFSNWLSIQRIIWEHLAKGEVHLDLSATYLVDHSTMEKLHELEKSCKEQAKPFKVIGLENHQPLSSHPLAARKKSSVCIPAVQK